MADILDAVGTVVSAVPNSLLPGYGVLPTDSRDWLTRPPFGVMLTNAVSPDDGLGNWTGGYAVVGEVDPMVVNLASTCDGEPIPGEIMYAGGTRTTDDGKASNVAELTSYQGWFGPMFLGTVRPDGPGTGTGMRYLDWRPAISPVATVANAADFQKTNSTVLATVTGVEVYVRPGRYTVDLLAWFLAGGVGGGGVQYALGGSATAFGTLVYALVDRPGVATSYPFSAVAGFSAPGDGTAQSYANFNVGFLTIKGFLEVTVAGTLNLRFAQASSHASVSQVNAKAFLRVEKAPIG